MKFLSSLSHDGKSHYTWQLSTLQPLTFCSWKCGTQTCLINRILNYLYLSQNRVGRQMFIQGSGSMWLQTPVLHETFECHTIFIGKVTVLPHHTELNHMFCKNYASVDDLWKETFLLMFIRESHNAVIMHVQSLCMNKTILCWHILTEWLPLVIEVNTKFCK